jgi:GT2 family glycosyltransferase
MFSIVIANWNGSKLIDKCLESLTKQSYKKFKVYIIDNGSKDDSISVINKYINELHIDLTELDANQGFAIANNMGIEKAFADENTHILTLNNDIEMQPNCLEKLKDFIKGNSQYDIFQILMLNYFDRETIDTTGLYFKKSKIGVQQGYKVPYKEIAGYDVDIMGASAGAAVYSKKCLKTVKAENGDYFDSSFFAYYEDVDLALRLLNSGFKTALVKDAVVYHMHSATTKKSSDFKEYYMARNLLLYLYKDLDIKEFNSNKLFYYKALLARIVRLALNGEFKCIKALLKGWKDFYKMRVK